MPSLCRSIIVDSPLTHFVPWWHSQSWLCHSLRQFHRLLTFFSLYKKLFLPYDLVRVILFIDPIAPASLLAFSLSGHSFHSLSLLCATPTRPTACLARIARTSSLESTSTKP